MVTGILGGTTQRMFHVFMFQTFFVRGKSYTPKMGKSGAVKTKFFRKIDDMFLFMVMKHQLFPALQNPVLGFPVGFFDQH